MTHSFEVKAGEAEFTGEIQSDSGGIYYFKFDVNSPRPNSYLNQCLSDAFFNIGKFLQAGGSLEKFEIKEL